MPPKKRIQGIALQSKQRKELKRTWLKNQNEFACLQHGTESESQTLQPKRCAQNVTMPKDIMAINLEPKNYVDCELSSPPQKMVCVSDTDCQETIGSGSGNCPQRSLAVKAK